MRIIQFPCGTPQVFSYLLGCEKSRRAVVIDPGDGPEIFSQLQGLGFRLELIINTHYHHDHIAGNGFLKEAAGAKVIRHGADEELWKQEYKPSMPESPAADRLVGDGEFLEFGDCSLQVLHTPGHSPGGICLYTPGNLFSGDSLFVGAAGRTDLTGGDFATLFHSLETKIAVLPDDTIVWPGHDYGDSVTSTIGREKKENPFLGGEWE